MTVLEKQFMEQVPSLLRDINKRLNTISMSLSNIEDRLNNNEKQEDNVTR